MSIRNSGEHAICAKGLCLSPKAYTEPGINCQLTFGTHLAESISPLKGKAPVTFKGGYNVKTGEVAARSCGGGKCAEDHVVDALGDNKEDVRLTEATRPKTSDQVPVYPRCESTYGREPFPLGARLKSDK